MASTTQELAYDAALRALTAQRARVDDMRGRAGMLLSAASLVTSFLGAAALKDTKLAGGKVVDDLSFQFWEIVGVATFVGVAIACIFVLWPRNKKWKFELDADVLVQSYLGRELTDVHKDLALHLERFRRHNEPTVSQLFWAFQIGAVLLFGEVIAWILDLT